jgi:hypothetical protein
LHGEKNQQQYVYNDHFDLIAHTALDTRLNKDTLLFDNESFEEDTHVHEFEKDDEVHIITSEKTLALAIT